MNKTIYMTYKKNVPEFVFSRWKALNKGYEIDFSLDDDCIEFLKEHFNDYIANLFVTIPQGMYKADLWRLCKLYIHGGVYADVDVVPYIDIDSLNKDISFYSCLSVNSNSIFQAFMVTFSPPRNPLILHFLISFLINNPCQRFIGPTFDMYECIQHNLSGIKLHAGVVYEINTVRIPVCIGSSEENVKYIDLHYFPENVEYTIEIKSHIHSDDFYVDIKNNIITVKRMDSPIGWGYIHWMDICISSNQKMSFFNERIGDCSCPDWPNTCFVLHKNKKILDSRDITYREW